MNESNLQRLWEPLWQAPGFPPDAMALGEGMVGLFKHLAGLEAPVDGTFELAILSLAGRQDCPIVRAAGELARDMDAGIGSGAANPYHNRQHFCEVVLSTLMLGRLEGMPRERLLRVLLAALAHDFHHDGQPNGAVPFRLERLAVDELGSYLAAAGVSRDERDRLEALILATEFAQGAPFARACHQYHRGQVPERPDGSSLPSGLERLGFDADLCAEAVMLTEADILPSVGLSIEHSMLCEQRLLREWHADPGPMDSKLAFLDKAMGAVHFSRHFLPNMQRLRASLGGCDPVRA